MSRGLLGVQEWSPGGPLEVELGVLGTPGQGVLQHRAPTSAAGSAKPLRCTEPEGYEARS